MFKCLVTSSMHLDSFFSIKFLMFKNKNKKTDDGFSCPSSFFKGWGAQYDDHRPF